MIQNVKERENNYFGGLEYSTPKASLIVEWYSVMFPVEGSTLAVISDNSIPVMPRIVFAASFSATRAASSHSCLMNPLFPLPLQHVSYLLLTNFYNISIIAKNRSEHN